MKIELDTEAVCGIVKAMVHWHQRCEKLEGALISIQANSAPDAVSLSPENRIKAFHEIATEALKHG